MTTSSTTLLTTPKTYRDAVQKLIEKSKESLKIAVAFWGKGADEELAKYCRADNVQLICNLAMGGTNPAVIQKLMDSPKFKIKQHDTLHAKVFIGEHAVIIGSANISANGLGLEESEQQSWVEAGIYSEDAALHRELSTWFEDEWNNKSKFIMDSEIKNALIAWEDRRKNRPKNKNSFNNLEKLLETSKNRRIYLCFWQGKLSRQNEIDFNTAKEKWKEQNYPTENLSCWFEYTEFDDYKNQLDSLFISVEYFRKKYIIDGPHYWKRIVNIDLPDYQIVEKISMNNGIEFSKEKLEELINYYQNNASKDTVRNYKIIDLYEYLQDYKKYENLPR